jgi:hypothetical protein
MTIPVLMNTTFLTMCWPASVGANGKRVNVHAGDQDQRHAVPTIYTWQRY